MTIRDGESKPVYGLRPMRKIVSADTMRWLVEVFFWDWKQYEGCCQMAKQPGIDGSNRGLISRKPYWNTTSLSLHWLWGSLRDHICYVAIMIFIQKMINSDNPITSLWECQQQIKNVVTLASSKKNLNHRILGRLDQPLHWKTEKPDKSECGRFCKFKNLIIEY